MMSRPELHVLVRLVIPAAVIVILIVVARTTGRKWIENIEKNWSEKQIRLALRLLALIAFLLIFGLGFLYLALGE